MNFFSDFFDDGCGSFHRGSQRYMNPLEKANLQIHNLANENEALQGRVQQLEQRLAQALRQTGPHPQQLVQRIRELEGALMQAQRELTASQQRVAAFEETISKNAPKPKVTSGRAAKMGPSKYSPAASGQVSSHSGVDMQLPPPTPEKEDSLVLEGFYIQDEENVSIKDQQIRELKEAIQDINKAYADYAKYKQYYEAREGGLQSQQPLHSAMDVERTTPKTDSERFEECRKHGRPFFQGTIVEGKPQGLCYEVKNNGESFWGTFRDGLRHGHGHLETPDLVFEGEFVDGELQQSQGSLRMKPKVATVRLNPFSEYTGEMVGGVPQGQGQLELSNGAKISGTFTEGRLDERSRTTIQVPEWSDQPIEVQLVPISGLDAFVVKRPEASSQLIWNLKTGELKSI